jgi:flagellar biosynthetic protein FlhB
MAEDQGYSRTEAPTPRRREEAREQGQVAISSDLSGGLLLLAAALGLWLGAEMIGSGMLEALRAHLSGMRRTEMKIEDAQILLAGLASRGLSFGGVFLGLLLLVALGTGVLQAGFHFLPDLVLPRWEKLSPAAGLGRMISGAAVMRAFVAVAKTCAVTLVVVWILKGRMNEIGTLNDGNLAASAYQGWRIVIRVMLAVAAALVVIGVVDYGFQRWRHEQSLAMSRQEQKEEVRRDEGDPLIRARLRKVQREISRKRMMADVPRASVVITNPTHLAVALRYERGPMTAPRVVAKGAGHLAERIKEIARQHAVPVVERKPVAQALFKAVAVGRDIPPALYHAVAEVLAYVYRLRGVA